MGAFAVIAAGKIAKIEGNAAYAAGSRVVAHGFVGSQEQPVILPGADGFQTFSCVGERLFLNIKGKNMSLRPGQLAEQGGIVAIAHGSVDTEIARLYLRADKLAAPVGDGYVFHEVPLFSGVYFRCMRERAGKYRILHKVLMIFIIGRKKKFYKLQNLDRGADFVYSIKDIKKKGCRSVIGNCYSRDMCCR